MNKRAFVWSMVALGVSLFGTQPANAEGISEARVVEWLAAYGEAWESRDADAAAALFSEDATYQENPFEDPFDGRAAIHDYWSRVTADQRDIRFASDVITTFGQSTAAHWSASFTSAASGATVNLDGVFLLEFDGNGLCKSLREWWIVKVDET